MRYFLLLLVALLFTCPVNAEDGLAGCATGGAQDFEIGFRLQSTHLFRITVENEFDGIVDSRIADPTIEIDNTGCHWIAHVGEPIQDPDRVKFNADTLHTLTFERLDTGFNVIATTTYLYMLCKDTAMEGEFYCPYGTSSAQPDIIIYDDGPGTGLRVRPTHFFGSGSPPFGGIEDYFGANWILPFNYDLVCVPVGPGCRSTPLPPNGDIPFMSKQLGPAFTTMADVDFVVPEGEDWHGAATM